MPVRYDIAAQIPQYSGGGMDPMNMMAQLQGMDYRQQQNALAQLQMQKLQRELQMQSGMQDVLRGLDVNSPDAVGKLSRAGYLPEALSVMGQQRQAGALRAQQAHYQAGEQATRELLPFQIGKYKAETGKEEQLTESARLTGEKTALERDAEMLKNAENQAAKIVMARGKGYDKFYSGLHDNLKGILPEEYDEEALSNFTTQMATVQENLKRAHEYELVDRVNPQTGLKEKVAVPKYAPEKGGKAILGTEGLPTSGRIQSQAFPAVPGAVLQSDESGNTWLNYPTQPGQRPVTTGVPVPSPAQPKAMPTNAMAPAPLLPQTSFTNAPPVQPAAPPSQEGMLAPRARMTNVESLGVTPAPLGTKERDLQDTATGVLRTLNYNPDTGVDIVESTLSRAPSGMLQAKGTDIGRVFGRNSAAASADAELKRLSASLVKTYSGDKLAAQGFSNTDAKRVEQLTADIGNSELTIGERRDAYRSLKREVTRQIGIDYKNPYDPQGIKIENVIRARVEESPDGFTVTDPDGGVHTFDNRKKAAEFLTYVQRMTVGKK